MKRGTGFGGLATSAIVAVLLTGCTSPSTLADKLRPLTSSRDSSKTAIAACKTWLTNGGPAGSEFRLVGAEEATLAVAKKTADDAGANTTADPNYSNYPGSTPVAICALTGPMAKVALTGNMLIYYAVMNSPANGVVANYDDPDFKKQ
jgi:hypothetical protein